MNAGLATPSPDPSHLLLSPFSRSLASMSNLSVEKHPFDEEAKIDVSSSKGDSSDDRHTNTQNVDERRLMRKIDLYLVPWLTLLYRE
jgi:hypothetical protein